MEHYLPNISVDTVIIGYDEGKLKCLLLRIGEKWMLPGGYVGRSESVEDAANRVLQERTHLIDAHLKFLSVAGRGDRTFDDDWKALFSQLNVPYDATSWVTDRFVSLVYYSLVHLPSVNPQAGEMDAEVAWFAMDELPAMWMDHASIVAKTRESLRKDVKLDQIAHHLLAPEFTMPNLHEVHQHILGAEIDRSRFQKKMLSLELFERLHKDQVKTPGRNPYLYRVKEVQS